MTKGARPVTFTSQCKEMRACRSWSAGPLVDTGCGIWWPGIHADKVCHMPTIALCCMHVYYCDTLLLHQTCSNMLGNFWSLIVKARQMFSLLRAVAVLDTLGFATCFAASWDDHLATVAWQALTCNVIASLNQLSLYIHNRWGKVYYSPYADTQDLTGKLIQLMAHLQSEIYFQEACAKASGAPDLNSLKPHSSTRQDSDAQAWQGLNCPS